MPLFQVISGIVSGATGIVKADEERKKSEAVKLDAASTAIKYTLVDKAFTEKRYDDLYKTWKTETDKELADHIFSLLKSVNYEGIGDSSLVGTFKNLTSGLKEALNVKIQTDIASGVLKKTDTSAVVAKPETNIQATIQKYWYVPVLAIGAFLIMPVIKNK